MNYIPILEPRWRDKTVLVADYKIGVNNQIKINHHNYPEPFYIDGNKLRGYSIQWVKSKQGNAIAMRVVPLADLSTDLVLEVL